MDCHSRRPIVIDLFCGAGGLSEGLAQAGFEPRVAVDFDANALKTYKANHPETEVIHGDIATVTGAQLRKLAGTNDIDLIAGGPSCQGFSTHGKRIQDDPRNFLFKHFVRIVDEVKPKMFLMENVRGMLTYSKGYFRKQIEDAFAEIGYRCAFTMVSTGALRRDCTTLYYRLDPKRPSYTITCYFRNVASGPFLHPFEDRSLSYREAARLMSFPDRYKFEGTNFTRQIGNAVPVLMAKAIGQEIVKSLRDAESQKTAKTRKVAA
jgi:site-specific DNA-cytosine methylase